MISVRPVKMTRIWIFGKNTLMMKRNQWDVALMIFLCRYMINYEYSKDLNINSMGRRIRTRLYFTSESHLHTVLNVFRFAQMGNGKRSLLSHHGRVIVNSTPELCYLTQVVIRVFEDNRRPIEDPRRFRVEILFSPGATATPMHMNELDREQDQSRFDTAPLQLIGREGLTCQEVEDFFEQAIMAGRSDEESFEIASTSTAAEKAKKTQSKRSISQDVPPHMDGIASPVRLLQQSAGKEETEDEFLGEPGATNPCSLPEVVETDVPPQIEELSVSADIQPPEHLSHASNVSHDASVSASDVQNDFSAMETVRAKNESRNKAHRSVSEIFLEPPENIDGVPAEKDAASELARHPQKHEEKNVQSAISRKYFWGTVAVASFGFGISCLVMALTMTQGEHRNRRWTKR